MDQVRAKGEDPTLSNIDYDEGRDQWLLGDR